MKNLRNTRNYNPQEPRLMHCLVLNSS